MQSLTEVKISGTLSQLLKKKSETTTVIIKSLSLRKKVFIIKIKFKYTLKYNYNKYHECNSFLNIRNNTHSQLHSRLITKIK